MPVIEHYEKLGKVEKVCSKFLWFSTLPTHRTRQVDSSPVVDEVHAATVVVVAKVLA